ncbi:MAG: TonB-dependent receptor [Desulfuromusa sp.]|nr:TonB-dependent receptor [Desulfuromusa sp.]
MRKIFIVLCALLLTAGPLWAEVIRLDPVVITATRIGTPLSQIASSVTVITAEEIEAKQQPLVLDLLRNVPGLDISRAGGAGASASISIRGAGNKHTMVLIDGIKYNDPSAIGGAADLANLTTDNIEQIEVVRGAQSVLYGSDAIGGVINIITKKGNGQLEGYASLEGGSYNTWENRAGISLGSDAGHLALTMSHSDTDGFSAANKKDGNNEKDGYKNTSLSLNAGNRVSDRFELNYGFHYTDADYEYDNANIDADNTQKTKELGSQVNGIFHLLDNRWQVKLGASYIDLKRDDNNEFWGTSEYKGTRSKLEIQNTLQINGLNTLIFGAESDTEKAENSFGQDDKATNNAIYIEDQFNTGNFITTVGVRYDNPEDFNSKATWRIAPLYTFVATGTRLKGSLGTGFKAPTLYELHDPYSGNSDLDAEKSLSYDIGVEQGFLTNSLIFDITWFHNDIKDYIEWVRTGAFTGRYQNGGDIKTQGIETSVQVYPSDLLDVQLSYTYTDTENKEDGSRLLKRPLHKGGFDLNLYPLESIRFNLNLLYVGDRDDYADEHLDEYILVNLAASYQINFNLKLFGRIDNLFDKDYEEVSGYGTAGLSGYAGIKLSF